MPTNQNLLDGKGRLRAVELLQGILLPSEAQNPVVRDLRSALATIGALEEALIEILKWRRTDTHRVMNEARQLLSQIALPKEEKDEN